MSVKCERSTSGGKGNHGMFYERAPKICAAGVPTAQPDDCVKDALEHYLLKDTVDALISDAIIPPKPPKPLPPLRHPIPRDTRNAGTFGDVAQIVNPTPKTKFQTLVDDFKETAYSSYWNKPLGMVRDPVPMLPEGFNILGTTFGKKTPYHGRLYDIVMPKEPIEDRTPKAKNPGVQIDRKYCIPPFNPNKIYGYRTFVDKRGTYAKCCLTDIRSQLATERSTVLSTIQSNVQNRTRSRVGKALAPNNNINNVPEGYSFGKLKPPDNFQECLSFCTMNPERDFLRQCLKHLNTLRKCLSTRYLPTFFHKLYLNLKYFDKDETGWLPKELVFKHCNTKFIRFNPSLIEPLLSKWQAFDGSNVAYKFFVHVINYREPLPDLPKIPDLPAECIDFRTTYTEMVKPGQEVDDRRMAGVPSGRYFDLDYPITPENCCRAIRTCLPQESDVKSCISPSAFTLLNVTHRDMYAKREPDNVKRVFEAAGVKFTEERFNAIWEEAKKYHSQGWVCFETFRRASEKITD